MENTYTYTARSADDPQKIVTFTLHDDKMSVGVGAPMEQLEQAVASITADEDEKPEEAQLWLKPLAISLIERGTGPFNVEDVDATIEEGRLNVKGWVRLAGLRGGAITLMEGKVDNPDAAEAFVTELDRRKAEVGKAILPFDYWLTWVGMIVALIVFFGLWQRRSARSASPATTADKGEQ